MHGFQDMTKIIYALCISVSCSILGHVDGVEPANIKGSPRYEVPTRPHTIWCGSPIQYDGPVSIILKICLNSFLSAHESVLLCLSRSEVRMPIDCKCLLCQWFFHCRGRGWEWVPSQLGLVPTLLGTYNKRHAQRMVEQSTRMRQSQHTREDNMYNTQWISLREYNGCYRKFYVKGLSNVRESSLHRRDNVYNTFSLTYMYYNKWISSSVKHRLKQYALQV